MTLNQKRVQKYNRQQQMQKLRKIKLYFQKL